MSTFTPFEEKMESAGISTAAIKAFSRCYEALVSNHSGMIPETDISPADQVADWKNITDSTAPAGKDLISQCVCIKLNGGLGTSMGLQKAKSLLKVKGEDTFLDLIVRQVKHLRTISGTPVRLLLMNSFSTSADTLAYLEKYAADGFADAHQVELMQNRVPKILADTLEPASYPQQPELEWCPPGHGDLYPALLGSGWLDRLLEDGVKYAFISNSDNLGAQLDMNFLRWFAESGAPFVMEVTRRTEADKKGGHLAVRKSDGHLILREVAQCPDADIPRIPEHFQAPLFQYQHALDPPGFPQADSGRQRRRTSPPHDPEQQDGEPQGPGVRQGVPAGNGHGRGHRMLPRRARRQCAALPLFPR